MATMGAGTLNVGSGLTVDVTAGCKLTADPGAGQSSSILGAGLVRVTSAELSAATGAATISNLILTTASVTGAGDVTVNTTLSAQSTLFTGGAGSLFTLLGTGTILAPVPGGQTTVYDTRGFTVDAGATKTITGDIELRNGATIENNGFVEVTANSTIKKGVGGGQVVNKQNWQILAQTATVEVPFTSQDGGGVRIENGSEERFFNFKQTTTGGNVILDDSGKIRVAQGRVDAGEVSGGQLIVDSQLDGSGASSLDLGVNQLGNTVTFTGVAVTTDTASNVKIHGDLLELNIRFDPNTNTPIATTFTLRGNTDWLTGNITGTNVISGMTDYGTFTMGGAPAGGDQTRWYYGLGAADTMSDPVIFFTNYGQLTKAARADEVPLPTEFNNVSFTNDTLGNISVSGIAATTGTGSDLSFNASKGTLQGHIAMGDGSVTLFSTSSAFTISGLVADGLGIFRVTTKSSLAVLGNNNPAAISTLELGDTAGDGGVKLTGGDLVNGSLPPSGSLFITSSFKWQEGLIQAVNVTVEADAPSRSPRDHRWHSTGPD